MSRPRVSVLTPARNAAATVGETVRSVLGQTLGDWELIVVDDGSTDETPAIVRAFDDPRVRLVEQPPAGVSAARNRAAREARGELLAFLDADDRFAPEKLVRQEDLLAAHPDIGSTYCAHRRIDPAGVPWTVHAPPRELSARDLLTGFPFNPSAQMVRRAWHERVGGFDVALAENEDRDYCLRLLRAGCRFARTDGLLADYRVRPAGGAGDWFGRLEQALAVLDRSADLDPAAADEGRALACQEYALRAAASGDVAVAARLLAGLQQRRPGLTADPDSRDELLQAAVDLAVRSRCDPDPLLDAVFAALERLDPELAAERRWAGGAAALLIVQRELTWGRRDAARDGVEAAARNGAGWDERTRRLMRHQCRQIREAWAAERWMTLAAELEPALGRVAPPRDVKRFVESVDGGGWARRLAGWVRSGLR